MRSTIIKTVIAISISVALFPQLASATTPSFSCSSNLVVSIDNGYSASCDGDFSFKDGVLQNDTSISLTAGGFLNVGANASLIAPKISLISENIIFNGNADIRVAKSVIPSSNTQLNILDVGSIKTSLKEVINWEQFEIQDGASVSFSSGSSPSATVLNSVGGSIVIRPGVTGNLISNAGAIIINNSNGIIVSSVPEPSAYIMMVLGLIPLGFMSKRKAS